VSRGGRHRLTALAGSGDQIPTPPDRRTLAAGALQTAKELAANRQVLAWHMGIVKFEATAPIGPS